MSGAVYFLTRHVVYDPGCEQTREVWASDRPGAAFATTGAPRFTDEDDPLGHPCSTWLLVMPDGSWVGWNKIAAWLSVAMSAGYEVVSGFQDMSPYKPIVIRGP